MNSGLDNPYNNIFIIFLCGVICWVASINSIKIGNGMGALAYIYLPLILTVVLMTIYLVSRLITKKKNWIITLISGLLLIVIGVITYFEFI